MYRKILNMDLVVNFLDGNTFEMCVRNLMEKLGNNDHKQRYH